MSEEKKQFIFYYTIESSVIIPRLFPEPINKRLFSSESWRLNTLLPRWWSWGLRCRRVRSETLQTLSLFWPANCWRKPKIWSGQIFFVFTRDWETAVRHPLNLDFMWNFCLVTSKKGCAFTLIFGGLFQ